MRSRWWRSGVGIFSALAMVAGCLDWSLPGAAAGSGGDGGQDGADAPNESAAVDGASDASIDAPPVCLGDDAGFSVSSDGSCVELVASGQGEVQHLRVIAGKIYWSTFGGDGVGRIMRANLDGTGAQPFYEAPGTRPRFIAAKENDVFWGEQLNATEADSPGAVRTKAIDGTLVGTYTTVTYSVRGIDANDTWVYWATWDGKIKRIPRARTDAASADPEDIGAGQVEPMELVADNSGYVYARAGNSTDQPGIVVAGGDAGWLTTEQPNMGRFPWGITIDGTRVVWTERGSLDGGLAGRIRSSNRLDGGMPKEHCDAKLRPLFVATDPTYIWFTEDNGGSAAATIPRGNLSRVSKGGGPCEVVISNIVNVQGIATGAGSVFWASRNGTVWRMRSP